MRLIWMTVSWLWVKTADGCLLFDSRWVINYSSAPASAAFACHVCLTGGLLWRDAGPIRAVHASASNVYLGKKKTAWYQREKSQTKAAQNESEVWNVGRTSLETNFRGRVMHLGEDPAHSVIASPKSCCKTGSRVPGLRWANEGKI